MPIVQAEATCIRCNTPNPPCGFYATTSLRRGHFGHCVDCHKEANRAAELKRFAGPRGPELRAKNREAAAQHEMRNQGSRSRASRRHHLRERYGMTEAEWEEMFDSQGRRCAICGTDQPCSPAGWSTDHCHSSGVVRFILCTHCNRGLGAFKDNPDLLRKAADMIEELK